ncbi:protein odr-4 homolog [Dunckerocampus dactyliophorus]|uniref:protein odr-4 homolog n=1 Tax=Dunckerocampus dactyliophorus TaxID=161453 RepID=UPI002405B273|nr:protein odr-4 homolog [Dunckerocampus dactyliophorus]XP_054623717.1 protein odr-4 homolog [Dunckerocampus dactyliophorus]
MGRGYTVDDTVEVYLSKLCDQQADNITGLLIGQSSPQRDFVVMACRTPSRHEGLVGVGKTLDKEWINEHARQVSRMLPGGLSVLGVFVITDADAKDTLTSLRQLVFTVQSLISSEHVWKPADDDVTDCLTLHINPKTRKIMCRTFDTKDPKSMAKPADWKYQPGICSFWSMVTCSVNVDLLVPLPDRSICSESMDKCLKEALKVWAHQIENAVCLIDGTQLPEDAELAAGQKRNMRQTFAAKLLITPEEHRLTNMVRPCGGSLSVRGTIHSRAYLHSNKPKAKLAEKLLKRDVLSSMVTRVHMLLEELLSSEEDIKGLSRDKQGTEQFCLPHRVFAPVKASGPLFVCDYQFNDEDPTEVIDRLKEMLDIDTADKDLDTKLEIAAEILKPADCLFPEAPVENVEVQAPIRNRYIGVAMATVVALLAAAASILSLNDI